jgi:cellulose synthase/poly-beta-1,6-N-acetylglucosamine synthase-like glycosyltransferase
MPSIVHLIVHLPGSKVSHFLQFVFWLATALVAYHYVIYPGAVIVLARLFGRSAGDMPDAGELPTVTVVIAAYNEERVIAGKLDNTLSLDYPAQRLNVIVAAHGSSDGTADIVRSYAARGVVVLHEPERRGKTAALNRAVEAASSDIIVFSDANNDFNADALRQLVRHFNDPQVGGVCGLKQIYDASERESSVGDGMYWKYESAIKRAESRLGSITTADGEIFAVRRALYRPIDESLINDDAAITLDLVRSGYRVLYETAARSHEHASIRIEDDFNVKVRMVSGGFQTLAHNWRFLLPPRSAFAVMFLSHKVLRWLAPELLILMFLSSLLLCAQPLYLAALVVQLAFYLLAWRGWHTRAGAALPTAVYVPFYFCAMNLAALFGFYRHLTRTTQWKKAQR